MVISLWKLDYHTFYELVGHPFQIMGILWSWISFTPIAASNLLIARLSTRFWSVPVGISAHLAKGQFV